MKKVLFIIGILAGLVTGIALDNAVLGLLLGIVFGLIISGALKTDYRRSNPEKTSLEIKEKPLNKARFDDGGFVHQDQDQDHDDERSHADDSAEDEFYSNKQE